MSPGADGWDDDQLLSEEELDHDPSDDEFADLSDEDLLDDEELDDYGDEYGDEEDDWS